ncbi:Hypothetical predicted protein [Octopus vulgaris]|uniref:Craniofacial development protein 2-like n=1 Tax=Octopus vulgaris TaxID=6645 RepID=A0AA36F559_OCTVU|nr:Hypothetical predicted protein [Octopus vulgaris]
MPRWENLRLLELEEWEEDSSDSFYGSEDDGENDCVQDSLGSVSSDDEDTQKQLSASHPSINEQYVSGDKQNAWYSNPLTQAGNITVLVAIWHLWTVRATIISAYAPQAGLPNEQKDHFYDILLHATSKTSDNDFILVAGDFNGHVGQQPGIFHGVHGSHGIGTRNEEIEKFTVVIKELDLFSVHFPMPLYEITRTGRLTPKLFQIENFLNNIQ